MTATAGHDPATRPQVPNVRGHELVETYDYLDETGELLFVAVRYANGDGKSFRQWRLDGAQWRPLGDARRVLYHLPRLVEHIAANSAEPIYIVEGEKDVHAVEREGGVATCNPMGAGKWSDEYAESLQGARRVIVVADRDEPGRAHARDVAASLERVGIAPELVEPAEGKDVSDHLADYCALGELVPVEREVATGAAQLDSFEIRVYTARYLATLQLPSPADPLVGPFVRRGMETLVGGPTGHGKTTLIAQWVKAAAAGGDFLGYQVAGGANVLVLDLEQHLASIQRVIREAGLDDCDTVDYAPIPEGLALDKRDDQLAALKAIFTEKAYDLVVVDPFYKLHEADSSDELKARELVALLRRWIKDHGFALLTATHCRKLPAGRNVITIDDLFGSSLFTRDPEIVLGIQRHGDLTKLHIFKSREPDLEYGQVFELLFTRGRGFWPKPTVDPEERKAELERIGETARRWINDNPGKSTNAVKKAVGIALNIGGDKVENALERQVKSGLLPEPLRGSRNAKLWYPLNHAALTSPESLLGEVTESGPNGHIDHDFTRPPDLPVGEREGVGSEVDEAELCRLEDLADELREAGVL